MRLIRHLNLLWLFSILLYSSASGVHAAQTVYLRDENGSLLARSRYVWFTGRRVLVPVSVYERLGFKVSRDFKGKRVKLAVPHSRTSFTYTVGQRTVREPGEISAGDGVIRYERPVTQIRGREFYIAAMALKEYFPNLIDTRWDRRSRTVTIQRQHELNRLLRFMD